MNQRVRSTLFAIVAATLACIAATGLLLPYIYAELLPLLIPHVIVDPAAATISKGQMVDDYFAVENLGAGTFAIGEPRYYQQNYSYLIVGESRALLFDAGSGTRDMRRIIANLTRLPVTVMVSHLHYDHLGGVGASDRVAMIDLPQTRARVSGGLFKASRYEYLGFIDGRAAPTFRVTEWLKSGDVIDLGGRKLGVLSTPGHTPTSVALFDPATRRLYIGDFMYPTTLYGFLPGASLAAYQATAARLLAALPADTILFTAHCCRNKEGVAAPWLTMRDLRDLDVALARIRSGDAKARGIYPRIYPVNDQMTFAAGLPWNNR